MRIELDYRKVKELLSMPKNIIIFSHRNPDGDAVGSSLALKQLLDKKGHHTNVLFPSEFPVNFNWMPESGSTLIYDINQETCIKHIQNADLFFHLDYNALDRIDKMGELVYSLDKPSIMIDHHLDPEPFADEILSDPSKSSTCELIYEFAIEMGWKSEIDLATAESIFTGLITDTGRFRFSTSASLYKVASELKKVGVRDTMINDYIFNNYTEKQLKLLGYCLYHRLEVIEEYHTAIISLTKQDYIDFNIGRGETEGIVNYMLMMPHIKVAAFITEQPTIIKYSFRSKGDISVQQLAQKHFNGGGHKNAAGGAAYGKLEVAIHKFKKLLPSLID